MTESKNKRPLFAGPWIAEFGWELFCWQGYIRAKMATGEFSEVYVCTRPGNESLYQDVIDAHGGKILTQKFSFENINSWKNPAVDLNAVKKSLPLWARPDCVWFKPDNFFRGVPGLKPIYIRPTKNDGIPPLLNTDILIHARNAYHCNSGFRNWELKNATQVTQALRAAGYQIGCIGLSETSHYVDGTINFMDLPLDALATVMSYAKVLVGPVSGPVHFATLYGLPQVTWVTHLHHEIRVRETWNPFKTPVTVFRSPTNENWRQHIPYTPEKSELIDAIIAAIKGEFR